MSTVRRQRWTLTSRRPDGCGAPEKYGISGCIPALVNSTVESPISEEPGISVWPREV